MPLEQIQNNESGLSARTKINQAIEEINNLLSANPEFKVKTTSEDPSGGYLSTKIDTDTLALVDNKIKVKDNVYSLKDHNHNSLYYGKSEIDTILESYATEDWVNNTLNDYVLTEDLNTTLEDYYNEVDIDAFFEGETGGKKQVHWNNITNKPSINEIKLDNNSWLISKSVSGEDLNVFKVTKRNTLAFALPVELSSLYLEPDSIQYNNIPITNQGEYEQKAGYIYKLGSENLFEAYGLLDGTGGLINKRLVVKGDIFSGSDLMASQSWVNDEISDMATVTWVNATFYTKSALDGGQLDNRYATETELATSGQASVNWGNLVGTPPATVLVDTFVCDNETAQLALTVQQGDVCVRTDQNKNWINKLGNNSSMSDWQELLPPTSTTLETISGLLPVAKGGTGKVTIGANKFLYGSATGVYSESSLSAFARTLLDDSDAETMRSTLNVPISSHNHNLNDLSEKSYNNLDDLPTLPVDLSDLNNDIHAGEFYNWDKDYNDLINKPSINEIKLDNNSWLISKSVSGEDLNVFKVTKRNTLAFALPVELSSLYLEPDSIQYNNIPITNQGEYEQKAGYIYKLGSENLFEAYGFLDGTGGITDKGITILGDLTVVDITAEDLTVDNIILSENINLEVCTSSAIGVIEKGGSRFLHDYSAAGTTGINLFIGKNAGNFSMAGTGSEASYNTGLGDSALFRLTTGYNNMGLGPFAGSAITTGKGNTILGTFAATNLTAGDYNIIIGYGIDAPGALMSNQLNIGDAITGNLLTGELVFANKVTVSAIANAETDTDKFIVSDGGEFKYRTGSQLASDISALVDSDFSSNGLMKRTGAGAYISITDNSSNWNTAFGWGDHSTAGYSLSSHNHNLADLSEKSYNSLSDKPTLPADLSDLNNDIHAGEFYAWDKDYDDLINTPELFSDINNNVWYQGKDFLNSNLNLYKVTKRNTLAFALPVELASLYNEPDSNSIFNIPLTPQGKYGEKSGYFFKLASDTLLEISALLDGTGGYHGVKLDIDGDIDLSGEITLGNSKNINFGTNKMRMYHDGSHGRIDVTTGNFIINYGGSSRVNVQNQETTFYRNINISGDYFYQLNGVNLPKILSAKVTLSSADLLGINALNGGLGKLILAAPGSGLMTEVISVVGILDWTYGNTEYETNTNLQLYTDDTDDDTGIIAENASLLLDDGGGDIAHRFTMLNGDSPENGKDNSMYLMNEELYLKCENGNPVNGDSPLVIHLLYRIITL